MSRTVALLDTTVQVDRMKGKTRRDRIDEILKEYDWKVTTSICLLEFKATLIQQCITIHDALRTVGRYTPVVDHLTESWHPQAKLRGHIFRNLINVYAQSSFDVTEERDRKLAEKARLALEDTIPRLYKWFTKKSVDAVLKEEIACTRALEAPVKKGVSFDVNIPNCKRGTNKFCRVEEFIRTKAAGFAKQLEAELAGLDDKDSHQLHRTCQLFKRVLDNDDVELSNGDCRKAGDCLIALEGSEHATHGLSTNASEWGPICRLLSSVFVRVEYPALREL